MSEPQPPALNERQQRWLTAFLVLGSAAFALVVLSYLATYWNFFADVILTFFLAWLLAFILSSPVRLLMRAVPRLPRVIAVVAVYTVLTVALLALVVLSYLATYWNFFADVILTFFLAWLLAFILSSPVRLLLRAVPRLPRVIAVVVVYAVLTVALLALVVVLAQALFSSLLEFIRNVPTLREQLPSILQPWANRLAALGFGQVDLVTQANVFLDGLASAAQGLVGPLQAAAVASIGVVGNILILFFLSVFMVIDSEAILSFILRVVPPRYAVEARLLEDAIGRSFGGFLRGQAIIGFLYAVVAFVVSMALGLPYVPVVTATAGVLMAIPFFGPFVAWVPPVLVAFVSVPDATVGALIGLA